MKLLPPALAAVLLLHGAAALPAFPGAVGYGAQSVGGRGGAVHIVTSLADSGPGTLRAALESSGPRTVVFEASGYIDLTSEISIADPFVTVAGQTSPGGVTVRGSRIKVRASNVIVRGMRFRPGDGSGDANCNSRDGFGIGTGSALVEDVVFDHCSATWGMDENGSSWYTSRRTTISNCLFAEGLDKQCGGDGGFGYLIGTSGTAVPPSQLSLIRNAFVSNRDRNPSVKDGATEIEVINNYSYNHVGAGLSFAGAATTVNAIKNYYKHGGDSIDRPSCYLHADSADLTNVYLEGNVDTRDRCDAAAGEETDVCHKEGNAAVAPGEVATGPVFVGSGFAAQAVDAGSVPGAVLAEVGAIHPARDAIDARILGTANMGTADCPDLGTGAVIASVAAVGGYPAVAAPAAPPDSDRDGIPDDVEDAMGLNKTDPSDSSGLAGSGYSYLEEYINSFYTGFSTGSPSQSPTKVPTQSPTTSSAPSRPTPLPTASPSASPSASPTSAPTSSPTLPPAPQTITSNLGSDLLWSDPATWQTGTVPGAGDDVVIEGTTTKVILDIMNPPLLNSITVKMGAVLETMDPANSASGGPMLLELFHLHVMHGASLRLGMPDNRIMGKVTIRLHGDPTTPPLHNHAEAGSKVVFIHDSNLDIHGEERSHTWTRLAATAGQGVTSLRVRGHVDWRAGEKIAVSSSDFDVEGFNEQFEAQELTIAASGPVHDASPSGEPETIIPVEEPLEYAHYGEKQCFADDGGNDHCVDTVAEVVLLSRNIVMEGDMDAASAAGGFGGHIKMHNDAGSGTKSRISFVEMRDVGQLGVLGSYPIHFHVPGAAAGSYAIGNSIHRSFNRAITIHGAQGIDVIKNVAFETIGHAVYLEDGTEMGNLIQENCVFNTRETQVDFFDTEDRTPASFWISNPNNTIIGNVAAGSRYAGFWIVPDKNLDADPNLCPRYLPLGEFRDNVAHSNFKYGIEVTRWLPKKAGASCSDSSDDEPAVLANNTIFKNGYNGLRFVGTGGNGAIVLDGLVAVDNARTYHTSAAVYWGSVSDSVQQTGTVGVRNAIFVQKSNNNPFTRNPLTAPVRAALKFPSDSDNVFVEDSVFVNYVQEGWVFDPDRGVGPNDAHRYPFEIPTRGLTFINSPNRVHFRFEHHGIVVDKDGSIAGYPSRIAPASPLYDMTKCSAAPSEIATTLANDPTRTEYDNMFHSVDLVVCDNDYTLRRLGRGEFLPGGSDDNILQTYEIDGNAEGVVGWGSKGRHALAAPTNSTINVRFDQGYLPDSWYQQLSRRYVEHQEWIHFVFHPPSTKVFQTFDIEFDGSTAPASVTWSDGNLQHVLFEGADEINIEMTFADAMPATSSPSQSPTAHPTRNPTASPSKSPTKSPSDKLDDGAACTAGSECTSGYCVSEGDGALVCASSSSHAHLFCRK